MLDIFVRSLDGALWPPHLGDGGTAFPRTRATFQIWRKRLMNSKAYSKGLRIRPPVRIGFPSLPVMALGEQIKVGISHDLSSAMRRGG